ncbi:MAG: 50S ribosomal protein L4 [Candidatus Micrarchaeia archaeon]
MKANVFDLNGKVKESIDLPPSFEEEVRKDLIIRATLAEDSFKRQRQGHFPLAGLQTSATYYGRRGSFRTGRHMGIPARPREKLGDGVQGKVKRIPSAVKGRRAKPHMVDKVIEEFINKKEYQKAIRSAISATLEYAPKSLKISNPIIISDDIEKISKTKEFMALLDKIGLSDYIESTKDSHIRKGVRRLSSQKHYKKSFLFVSSKECPAIRAAANIAGADAATAENVTANMLAPGGHPGRIVVWSESAVKNLESAIKKHALKPASKKAAIKA